MPLRKEDTRYFGTTAVDLLETKLIADEDGWYALENLWMSLSRSTPHDESGTMRTPNTYRIPPNTSQSVSPPNHFSAYRLNNKYRRSKGRYVLYRGCYHAKPREDTRAY